MAGAQERLKPFFKSSDMVVRRGFTPLCPEWSKFAGAALPRFKLYWLAAPKDLPSGQSAEARSPARPRDLVRMQVDPLRRHAPQLVHIDLSIVDTTRHLRLRLPAFNYESPLSKYPTCPAARARHLPSPRPRPRPHPSRFPHRMRTRVKHTPRTFSQVEGARAGPPAAICARIHLPTPCAPSPSYLTPPRPRVLNAPLEYTCIAKKYPEHLKTHTLFCHSSYHWRLLGLQGYSAKALLAANDLRWNTSTLSRRDLYLFPSTMSPTSLTNRYRLIYALCLLQILITVPTISAYPLTDACARFLQLSPAFHASTTIWTMYTRIVHPKAGYSYSVVILYYGLQGMGCLWVSLLVCFYIVKDVPEFEPLTSAFASCASTPCSSFVAWKCILLGLGVVLPVGMIVAFFRASLALKRRAIALYGTEMVVAPLVGSSAKEAKLVPAWWAALVADVMGESPPLMLK